MENAEWKQGPVDPNLTAEGKEKTEKKNIAKTANHFSVLGKKKCSEILFRKEKALKN